ncbi:MAG: hypothetical protein HRU82_16840 [Nitrospira sp.]|nr:MAG: hypothetical protein HRU82_16840 [Nitrospira sp.]
MNHRHRTARIRIMIVDPDWHFGLELADCLATSGYQAVLTRSLESMMEDLGELQPGAILVRAGSDDATDRVPDSDTLRALKALCPDAPVLSLLQPTGNLSSSDRSVAPSQKSSDHACLGRPLEEVLRTTWGIRCERMV